jgi:cysteinyl-tRNA synthetase
VFDSIIRYLQFLGYQVNYIRNITDVDDKILNRAKQSNESFSTITKKFTTAMHADFAALNLLPPTKEPKATDFIQDMLKLIADLVQKDYAYVGTNGDVFFSVNKFKPYGQLSKRDFTNMQHTDRVEQEVKDAKRNVQDFVLWKLVDSSEVGWDSEFGYGRPGWHIECSAMALKLFGNTFDIHGGGFDLTFPHHENEIAQSEAATATKFTNYWMHVGFLRVNEEKMSKSLNNFILIKDLLAQAHPEVIRYFVLSAHYRSQVEFSYDKLAVAKHSLGRLYLSLRDLPSEQSIDNQIEDKTVAQYKARFLAAMNDDFNTPLAFTVLFEIAKELNIAKEQSLNTISSLAALLVELGNSLGILLESPQQFLHSQMADNSLSIAEIEDLVNKRNQARQDRNWQLADQIRDQLKKHGIQLEDQGDKTVWRS